MASLEEMHDIVTKFFVYEIYSNPQYYRIAMEHIPLKNPGAYVDKEIERIRKRLVKLIITVVLKRQTFQAKILLKKLIDKHLEEYLDTFRRKVMQDHFKSWWVITMLEELRSK